MKTESQKNPPEQGDSFRGEGRLKRVLGGLNGLGIIRLRIDGSTRPPSHAF
jgi:hypothetical protein